MQSTLKILRETVVPISDPDGVLPKGFEKHNLKRWINIGLKNRQTGQRIYLEGCYRGGLVVTSLEAIDRFLAKRNAENPERDDE